MYRLYFGFLETADEYFEYPSHNSRQAAGTSTDSFSPMMSYGRFTGKTPCSCFRLNREQLVTKEALGKSGITKLPSF